MTLKPFRNPLNRQVVDEAAEWFVEFATGEPDARARRAFDSWLRESPDRVRAYLELFSLWDDAASLAERELSADDLIALARSEGGNVVPLASTAAPQAGTSRSVDRRKPGSLQMGLAAAAILALMIATGWFLTRSYTYETGIGEQRIFTLADGSNVELNSRSKLHVHFSGSQRRIELLSGQALFSVARDKDRPFVVESGDTRVLALGTQFDVNQRRSGIVVTVVEGSVAVQKSGSGAAPLTRELPLSVPASKAAAAAQASGDEVRELLLAAGEQVTVTPTAFERHAGADVGSATAWRQHRLVFSSTPLPEVVDEFNRYNERQLVVSGDALDTFNVSAVFSATDLTSLLRFLRAQPQIAVEESDGDIRVSAKPR
jgi:transmembrane sensor